MRAALLAAVLVVGCIGSSEAQNLNNSLVGVGPIRVFVPEGNNWDAIGLTVDSLSTVVELWLRQRGIPIADLDSYISELGRPHPTLEVDLVISNPTVGQRSVAYGVAVELYEVISSAAVARRGDRPTNAIAVITWREAPRLGVTAPNDSARTFILEGVVGQIDAFSNAYLAANPR